MIKKSLWKRLKALEKMCAPEENHGPACIIIVPQSARLDAEEDTSEVVRYQSNGLFFDREPRETEETFTERVFDTVKPKIYSPLSVPVLLATTENMVKTENNLIQEVKK